MNTPIFLSEVVAHRTYIRKDEFCMQDVYERYLNNIPKEIADEVGYYIKNKKIVPSMRMFNFFPFGRDEMYYNCSYLAIDCFEAIAEVLYLLTCGCGVGFSVEKKVIKNLPKIQTGYPAQYIIGDCRESWADSILLLTKNPDIQFDYSNIRPYGTPLSIGGIASGPEPLRKGHELIRNILKKANGRQLTSIEIFDICCHIADLVVVGGVRRSAMIALFDLNDEEMFNAKAGDWWVNNPQRARANISAVLPFDIEYEKFREHILHAVNNNGEPGYFFRLNQNNIDGLNPCGEIGLESCQFCNLTEVIASNCINEEELLGAIRAATILGTYQSTFVNFKYIRNIWKENCERDRLLGVSITGIALNQILHTNEIQEKIKKVIKDTNKEWAKKLGINEAKRLMAIKPSGTTSVVYNCSSGIHLPYSEYYLRSVRVEQEYVVKALKEMFNNTPFLSIDKYNPNAYVFSVPIHMKSSCGYSTDNDALKVQINLLDKFSKIVNELSGEDIKNGVSCTLNISKDDVDFVARYLYDRRGYINRCTVFPIPDEISKEFALEIKLPFIKITEEEYNAY
ncbi:MAG: hypothetical protein QXT71_06200, partial [Thermoplasmata archaeon]